MEQSNTRHKSKVGEEWQESSPAERDLRVLVSSRLRRNLHCALVDKRAKYTLGANTAKPASPKRLSSLKCLLNYL